MRIVVAGLGYLGSTVAACAAADGHDVVGIDPDTARRSAIEAGSAPVSEPGLDELIAVSVHSGRLITRADIGDLCATADMAIVCVGTPANGSGKLDLSQVLSITESIGRSLRSRAADKPPLAVVYRSTLTPGTMDDLVLPLLAATSSTAVGTRFEAAYNPETLREGTAIADYRNPTRIILGERSPGATRRLHGLYDSLNAPVFELSYRAAELAKLADNSFHALKIAFANELGRFALALDLDARELHNVFVADHRLNISAAYLRPGGPFGGLCLGKDTEALVDAMKRSGVDSTVLASIVPSNTAHEQHLFRTITDELPTAANVMIFGVGFKSGSLDLRQSPALALAARLIDIGHSVGLFDPDVTDADEFRKRLPPLLAGCWRSDFRQAARDANLVVCWKPAPSDMTARRLFDVSRLAMR